jgi:hypothetical protein
MEITSIPNAIVGTTKRKIPTTFVFLIANVMIMEIKYKKIDTPVWKLPISDMGASSINISKIPPLNDIIL